MHDETLVLPVVHEQYRSLSFMIKPVPLSELPRSESSESLCKHRSLINKAVWTTLLSVVLWLQKGKIQEGVCFVQAEELEKWGWQNCRNFLIVISAWDCKYTFIPNKITIPKKREVVPVTRGRCVIPGRLADTDSWASPGLAGRPGCKCTVGCAGRRQSIRQDRTPLVQWRHWGSRSDVRSCSPVSSVDSTSSG